MALTFDVFHPVVKNGAAVLLFNSGGFRSPDLSRQCTINGESIWTVGFSKYEYICKDDFINPPLLQQFSFQEFLEEGFTVFDIRHGSTPKFTLDEIVKDCRQAVKFIKYYSNEFKIDSSRIGLWGCSAGGYLAAFIGMSSENKNRHAENHFYNTSSKVQAIGLYYPGGYYLPSETYLRKVLPALHIKESILDSLSIKHQVSADDPPILIIYGEQDFDFIENASDSIYTELQENNVISKKIVYPNVGHTWQDKEGKYNKKVGDRAMAELVDWFKQYLNK